MLAVWFFASSLNATEYSFAHNRSKTDYWVDTTKVINDGSELKVKDPNLEYQKNTYLGYSSKTEGNHLLKGWNVTIKDLKFNRFVGVADDSNKGAVDNTFIVENSSFKDDFIGSSSVFNKVENTHVIIKGDSVFEKDILVAFVKPEGDTANNNTLTLYGGKMENSNIFVGAKDDYSINDYIKDAS